MAVADITVVPWYPVSDEEGGYALVDKAIEVIKDSGLKYEVGPMSTAVEGSLEDILQLIPNIHALTFENGVERVLTTLRIDDVRNGHVCMEEKVKKHRNG